MRSAEFNFRNVLGPAAAAVALRVALIAAACALAHISVNQFALLHDGWEYMRLARAFAHGGVSGLDPATLRLFPGYPLLIAIVGVGRAYVLPGLVISIGCAVLCGALAGRLGRDRRIAWYMAVLTPSWLMFSSTVMSDSLALALVLLGLIAIERRFWVMAGFCAGLSFIVRPVGALLMIPIAIEAFSVAGTKALARALIAALPLPIAYFLISRIAFGDAMRAVHQYTAQDFAWPLTTILFPTRNPNMSRFWIVYQYAVLAITWLGAFGLWRQMVGRVYDPTPEKKGINIRPLLIWHICAGLFYLLLPSSWAFQALDRFYIAVWPTTLIGLAPWLPKRKSINVAIVIVFGAISFAIALRWLVHLAAVFPFASRGF